MKVLLATGIYPPEIGGPASFTRELARELKRRGHEPSVVCYGDEMTLKGEGWDVRTVAKGGGWFIRYVKYTREVRRLAKKNDIVFLQGPVSEGFPGMIGAKLAGKPAMMKVVGDYAWEIYRQAPGNEEMLDDFVKHGHRGGIWLREKFERWSSRRAKTVVVPSRYLKKIVEAWGVAPEKIRVIYNTIPPLPPTKTRDEMRTTSGLTGKKLVLTVVRAVPWKHGDFLCEVLAKLPEQYRLAIVGDGPSLEDWKRRADGLGVASRVIFAGKLNREKVAEWYAMADVFALPSGYEGFPHVVAEAASVGLPSLVSDQGGNPETQELFPGLVTVLPYLDVEAWRSAVSADVRRGEPKQSASFEELAAGYLEVLKPV